MKVTKKQVICFLMVITMLLSVSAASAANLMEDKDKRNKGNDDKGKVGEKYYKGGDKPKPNIEAKAAGNKGNDDKGKVGEKYYKGGDKPKPNI